MTSKKKTRYAIGIVVFAVCTLALYLFFADHGAARLYRVTVLPSLGGDHMEAHAVNDHGQVVGIAQTKDGQWRLYLWDREHGVQDLGATDWGRFDLNNGGQIAGSATDPNGDLQAFLWESGRGRTFLGTLGGKTSSARALNNRGRIVGISQTAGGADHAFLWDPAQGMRDLGTLGGAESHAWAINDAGTVFGLADKTLLTSWPFVWEPNDGMTEIGPPTAAARLNGINSASWVVGEMVSRRRMALWRKGSQARELFPLDHDIFKPPLLNDANQVVFCERSDRRLPRVLRKLFPPQNRHYLWDARRGRIPLDSCSRARRGESFAPMDINNQGWIVGVVDSGSKNARVRAVLLEPIPERWGK